MREAPRAQLDVSSTSAFCSSSTELDASALDSVTFRGLCMHRVVVVAVVVVGFDWFTLAARPQLMRGRRCPQGPRRLVRCSK
eukprot:2702877-Alexandrium_andersonii.AAC.1